MEPYTTRVPRSQRGGEIVEPLVREQWFVKMKPLAEPALKVGVGGWWVVGWLVYGGGQGMCCFFGGMMCFLEGFVYAG